MAQRYPRSITIHTDPGKRFRPLAKDPFSTVAQQSGKLFDGTRQPRSSTFVKIMASAITFDILERRDASTTNSIIQHFESDQTFLSWADYQSKMILKRDEEDGEKLQHGIDVAVERGTLQKLSKDKEQAYENVDVVGKTPGEVSDKIWEEVLKQKERLAGAADGELIVLCGLSGTGKGTTFATLGDKLRREKDPNKVVNWSNGNVFRSVTLLCNMWCEQNTPGEHDVTRALTKENIAEFMSMLTFGKFDGKYDTHIEGLGLKTTVSRIENTLLKQSSVARNIPTVAEQIQGEVVRYANDAMSTLREAGMTILLEGREQTLNYMETPHKFRLVLSDESLIGKRRAAQRLMAETLDRLENKSEDQDFDQVLNVALQTLAENDIGSAQQGCCDPMAVFQKE